METRKELTCYFPHDANARNSDKLIRLRMRHKAAGYGVFFMILERLREEPDYMSVKDYNMIAFDLREDASLIKSVIEDFGLFVFTEDGKYFYSESFKQRMGFKDEKSRKRSEAGKLGMAIRWGNNNNITNNPNIDNIVITKEEKNITIKGKERKEKKNIKKESAYADKKENDFDLKQEGIRTDYAKFLIWVDTNTPAVKKIQRQITQEEFIKLKQKYNTIQITDILEKIDNYKDAPKKYTSVYRTFLNWAKKEYG